MRRRTIRVAAVSLSTITLAGNITFPVYAEASEDTESLIFASSDTIVTQQEAEVKEETETVLETVEDTLSNDVTELSESIDAASGEELVEEDQVEETSDIIADTETVKENIQEAVQDIEDIEAAKDDMDDASQTMDETVSEAVTITEDIKETTEAAREKAEEAVSLIEDDQTDIYAADEILTEVESTVAEAEEQFTTAEETYNEKLSEYETAKAEYEAAANTYNQAKDEAVSDVDAAEEALIDAGTRLSNLEEELNQSKQELVDAGAEALVLSEDNKETDIKSYIATVVEYYYAPNTQLSEGQSIANCNVVSSGDGYVTISYDVLDENGNILRNVTADYGYTVDSETKEVRIYDNQLVYEYTDAQGIVHTFTKEEAEALNYQVATDYYWTGNGFYIPRYTSKENYKGTMSSQGYSDSKAIKQGQNAIKEEMNNSGDYYNTNVAFSDGIKWVYKNHVDLDINYNVSYDKVQTLYFKVSKDSSFDYSSMVKNIENNGGLVLSSEAEYYQGIIRYIQGYQVNETIANANYSSYTELINAITNQAISDQGASGIDLSNSSGLNIQKNTEYTELSGKRINSTELFSSISSEYTSYITNIAKKLSTYNNLSKQVASAQDDYDDAKSQVESLKKKIENLNYASDINVAERLVTLEIQLEKAQANYEEAKENLQEAQDALNDAYETFDIRFLRGDTPSYGAPTTPAEDPVTEEDPTGDPVIEEDPTEDPVIEEDPAEDPVTEEDPEEDPIVEDEPVEDNPIVEDEPAEETIIEEDPVEENPTVEEEDSTEPEQLEEPEVIIEDSEDELVLQVVKAVSGSSNKTRSYPAIVIEDIEELEELEELEEPEEEVLEEDVPIIVNPSDNNSNGTDNATNKSNDQSNSHEDTPDEEVTIEDEETPKGITLSGIMERGKWFIGLGGVATAGVGVAALEIKRKAAMKIIDKLNQ